MRMPSDCGRASVFYETANIDTVANAKICFETAADCRLSKTFNASSELDNVNFAIGTKQVRKPIDKLGTQDFENVTPTE